MIAYTDLPDSTRVWIYQSNCPLDDYDSIAIKHKIQAFTDGWNSHGADVKAYGDLFYNRFIVLMANENAAKVSGCSIDSSIQFIRILEQEYNVSFFDRFHVAYQINGAVQCCGKDEFQKLIDDGTVNEKTLVFNNLVETKLGFESKWKLPLKESWHGRVFRVKSPTGN